MNASDGLEVQAFQSPRGHVHVAWTVNGKAAPPLNSHAQVCPWSVREMVSAYGRGETAIHGVYGRAAYQRLSDYLLAMHGRGVFFRDLSGGSVLCGSQSERRVQVRSNRYRQNSCIRLSSALT